MDDGDLLKKLGKDGPINSIGNAEEDKPNNRRNPRMRMVKC